MAAGGVRRQAEVLAIGGVGGQDPPVGTEEDGGLAWVSKYCAQGSLRYSVKADTDLDGNGEPRNGRTGTGLR